jgi:hypothetical protein
VHRGGRYDNSEDRSPSPEPPGPQVFSKAIRETILPARFRPPTTLTKYNGETKPELWLTDFRLACQLGGATDDRVIIRQLPLSCQTPLEPGSRIFHLDRSTTGTIS